MLELFEGPLDVPKLLRTWYEDNSDKNYGAFIPFVGTVRSESDIQALSFDVYEPILRSWFDAWQEKAHALGAHVVMAHSIGDVPVHTSSYIAGVFSPKRRVALELIDTFVEDFKASAPIWKYDVKNGKRIYAQERSTAIQGSGILQQGTH